MLKVLCGRSVCQSETSFMLARLRKSCLFASSLDICVKPCIWWLFWQSHVNGWFSSRVVTQWDEHTVVCVLFSLWINWKMHPLFLSCVYCREPPPNGGGLFVLRSKPNSEGIWSYFPCPKKICKSTLKIKFFILNK